MTNISLKDLIGLYTQVREAFAEEVPCEYPGHVENEFGNHDGGGEWYIKFNCQMCGYTNPRLHLVCDLFVESLREGDAFFRCPKCQEVVWGNELYEVVGRK
jgi:predicted RNA-binding Zn-ribbon protein involved in translation (DUF1610 family)